MNFLRISTVLLLGWTTFLWAGPRIITTSPALTELLFQLGQGDKIVGASEYSDVPLAAKNLPRIGSLFHPSIEKTLQLRPDLIFIDSFTLNHSYVQAIDALKLRSISFRIDSVESLFTLCESMLRDMLHSSLEPLVPYRSEMAQLELRARPFRFLVLTWAEPAIAATRKTFLSNLFEIIGGENLVPSNLQAPYVPLSKEWLLQSHPQFVFILHGGEPGVREKVAGYFPGNYVKILPLSSDDFARTNFSGLKGLRTVLGEMWH